MPTLLAPNRIPLLQLHLGVAIPTQILRQRTCDALAGGGVGIKEAGLLGLGGLGEGWGDVGFTGHGGSLGVRRRAEGSVVELLG